MKVERTQLPLASASKQISIFAASRRVDASPDLSGDEANKRKQRDAERDREDDAPASLAPKSQEAVRALNITA